MMERLENRPGGVDILPCGGEAKIVQGGEEVPYEERAAQPAKDADEPKRFSIGIFALAGWVVCLVCVLWLFSLSAPFMAGALTSTGWRSYVSLALAAFPFAASFCILVYALIRLRKTPRIVQFDSAAVNKPKLQRELTAKYLAFFPSAEKYAEGNGYKGEAKERIVASLARLTGGAQADFSDSAGWLEEFRQFQRMQDERASEIIRQCWKTVGIQTAALPWRAIDMLSVLYNSTVMITRLASLYNRRTSPQGAFRLACRWLFNIFAAGELGDMAAGAAESGGNAAAASLNGFSDSLAAILKPVSALAGRVAEGGANAFLAYRLGQRAIIHFRPLK